MRTPEEREAAARTSLPAALDSRNRLPNGRFVPGNAAVGAGRPKGRKNFATLYAELPVDIGAARALVAQTLGVAIATVPEFEDRRALLWWMREQQAFKGHEAAIEDLLTRLDAKPSRVQIEGELTHRAAPPIGGRAESDESRQAAEEYMDALEGEVG